MTAPDPDAPRPAAEPAAGAAPPEPANPFAPPSSAAPSYAPPPYAPPSYAGPPSSIAPAERTDGLDAGPHATPDAGPTPTTDSFGRPLRRRRRRRTLGPGAVVGLVLLALVAGAVGGVVGADLREDRRPADAALPAAVTPAAETDDLAGVAAIAAQVLPSVVSIEVRGDEGQGTGSGFVLRSDGYILTNDHVVAAAASGGEIVVVFADGSQEPAALVGRTQDYDLAVIRVERTGLRPLALGDSDDVVVGDTVVAIGAPLGLQGTVTTGIVSALNRPVSAGGGGDRPAFINAIQTDAAINPGNSGGPLVDLEGQVVGINSAIAQRPGATSASGSIGLGFAIPSNQARRTAEQLIETGTATYPIVGVSLDGRYDGEGVLVAEGADGDLPPVVPGGPAERAGIRPGDVILAIDGRPVTEADELIVAIRAKAPGDAVTLTVRTDDGEPRDVRVVLDEVSSDG